MRLSNILLAIAATTLFVSGNALSDTANSETVGTNLASSAVIRSLESNGEPKRLLRSYKEEDEKGDKYDSKEEDEDDSKDEDEDDSLDSDDEERAVRLSKTTFNKMLATPTFADDQILNLARDGMTLNRFKELLRIPKNKNERYY
ncbi:hypothetical protein BBO99_00008718 [Phytophthora kernoviae]|uniref:RxLR effector protein n=2 Tax=Phytophthora kernoviae TaxID=325452 RepID=A0A3R7FWV7_9STRA|nr:hypothetical protein G195_011404 [Phytophthora kernoviae 00238/432]KAG2504212.1 hypothetical protein JM18_009578 [Phytophthora kernoviae]KAG2509920.1 hypothetical protein JM16_008411 [Phytophthora kernoviae]RLN02858.1 hypothetical protein BBI17_008645 [Phytophthora kernoviae]RLN74831.1 hypothetical protein BBO99_00008718 [Phytophthora kernoviae]